MYDSGKAAWIRPTVGSGRAFLPRLDRGRSAAPTRNHDRHRNILLATAIESSNRRRPAWPIPDITSSPSSHHLLRRSGNLQFYEHVYGSRLVEATINFDDPSPLASLTLPTAPPPPDRSSPFSVRTDPSIRTSGRNDPRDHLPIHASASLSVQHCGASGATPGSSPVSAGGGC